MSRCIGVALLAVTMAAAASAGFAQARAGAAADRGPGALYQRAIVECRQHYWYDGTMWLENCFFQKTGKFPWQVGVPFYPPRQVRR